MELIVKTFHGLEEVLAEELRQLGAANPKPLKRAVAVEGDLELMYKANLHLRTALRVLRTIHKFRARNEDELYRNIYQYNWGQWMGVNQTLAIDPVVSSEHFRHSRYVALKVKDAIVDQFRKKTGRRPSVDTQNPDLRINVHVWDQEFTLSLDSSGDSLHKRGYRARGHRAPLNEALAAGMILLSEWDGKKPLIDPMCGSGTIPMEAAMISAGFAPGLKRKGYGFMDWKDYDPDLWKRLYTQAIVKAGEPMAEILASDISGRAMEPAQEAVDRFKFNQHIRLMTRSFQDVKPKSEEGILFMNPPYGERLLERDLFAMYKMIGDHLKTNFSGFDAWILSSNLSALKHVGLRPSRKITLFNGPLECKFQKFSMYRGSKKARFQN